MQMTDASSSSSNRLPKVLIVDIETYPNLYYSWRIWEGHALDIKEFSTICCWSAKWLGGKQTTKALPDYPKRTAEQDLIKDLWNIMDEADVIVAHNGRGFDFGRMNAQFIKWGLNPPSPSQKIDTKQVAKKVFGFESNSLDNLCQLLDLGKKMATGGYELWKNCMAGDTKAWAKMKKYNAYDVTLLEKLYLKLRPWMPNHPNAALFVNREDACPKCGERGLRARGVYRSTTRTYQRFQCISCGGWARGTNLINKTRITNTSA